MNSETATTLLKEILSEILEKDGSAATDRFRSLRDVDAKTREAIMVIGSAPGIPPSFVTDMQRDEDFGANSRRVRLEALGNYSKSALKILKVGGISRPKIKISRLPDVSLLTGAMPALDDSLKRRWREAQICQHAGAHLSAIILMGSILEGLLVARVQLDAGSAYQATASPKDKKGKNVAIPDWNLNSLIDVAVELDWLKRDRGKFSHALRESRNIVHPWVEVAKKANFDGATCKTCWEVLKASVGDLMESVK